MARTKRSGVKPNARRRCMVEGCPEYGIWREVKPDEEYLLDTADPRSHYWRVHYVQTEAEYAAKINAQREKRMAHYRATGEFLPPEV